MITSLTLAYISKSGSKSVVSDIKPATQQTQPALPVAQPDSLPEMSETDTDTASPEQQIPVTADTATTLPVESVDESNPVDTPATETPVTSEE